MLMPRAPFLPERWLGPIDLDTLLALSSQKYQCLWDFNRLDAILSGNGAHSKLVTFSG